MQVNAAILREIICLRSIYTCFDLDAVLDWILNGSFDIFYDLSLYISSYVTDLRILRDNSLKE